jgi:methyl-accepting chemotaxis protein
MAAISSSAGLQAATQAAFQQLKVQQARQNAERAEQTARALESKAVEAQQVADRAQENARSLSVRSSQAQSVAGQARQGLAMIRSVEEMQTGLSNTVSQANERMVRTEGSAQVGPSAAASAPPVPDAQPVVNTSGQVTGTVVNTTA